MLLYCHPVGTKRASGAQKKVGGLAFYLSLLALLSLVAINLINLVLLLTFERAVLLGMAAGFLMLGGLLARLLIRGGNATFLHELKHAVVANLSGNRAAGMVVNKHSGEFTYKYTKATAHLNAFISLAPYFFPLLTIPAALAAALLWNSNHLIMLGVIGTAFGADLELNTRDISPVQTDLTDIRGGYAIGVLYAVLANLTVATVLAGWAMGGVAGLQELGILLVERLYSLSLMRHSH